MWFATEFLSSNNVVYTMNFKLLLNISVNQLLTGYALFWRHESRIKIDIGVHSKGIIWEIRLIQNYCPFLKGVLVVVLAKKKPSRWVVETAF
jgi:hypothetical protein